METITITKQTARRFVLGKQGLWPGRRWAGVEGLVQAINAIEAVQLDPLNVVARSQDIVLWSRVRNYRTADFQQVVYAERRFLDYGDPLFVYPMEELPYWRLHMTRKVQNPRWSRFAAENGPLLEAVRAEVRARGPVGNRDFAGNARVHSYRGRKDTALALFYLWLGGELMISRRQGFERVYDLRERVAPAEHDWEASEAEAAEFFARKTVAFVGLARGLGWRNALGDSLQRRISPEEGQAWLDRLVGEGTLALAAIEGSKETRYVLSEDLPRLASLEAGQVPPGWEAVGATTEEEAVLLAPLDIVSARGRAKKLFDFEYVWEVYKPAHLRRWGYYTLPVLYGDRLVARLDPKLDRATATLVLNGFWLEESALAEEEALVQAFAKGLSNFAAFLEAGQIDLQNVNPPDFRRRLERAIGSCSAC